MRVSEQTVAILKNMADINNSLYIKQGQLQKTRAQAGNIHFEATLEEDFPNDFGIWDLSSFISMLTLFEDSDVEFGEKSLTISKDENCFQFWAADEEIVKPVNNKIPEYESLFDCELSANDIQTIKKTANILKARNLSFIGDGSEVFLMVGDHAASTKNTYRRTLGAGTNKFAMHLDISVFKLMVDTYKVSITSKKFIHFASQTIECDYVLATLQESTIG